MQERFGVNRRNAITGERQFIALSYDASRGGPDSISIDQGTRGSELPVVTMAFRVAMQRWRRQYHSLQAFVAAGFGANAADYLGSIAARKAETTLGSAGWTACATALLPFKRKDRTTRRDRDYLLPLAQVGDRIGANDASRILTPQLLPGFGIEREEVAFVAASKDQLAGG